MKVSEEELNHAYDTEFEGTELIDAVEELLNLRKRVEELEGTIEDWYKHWERDAKKYLKMLEDKKICPDCGTVDEVCDCPFG